MSSRDDTLHIAIETPHPVVLSAAWHLGRAWLEGGGRSISLRSSGEGPSVRIGLGSLVRPSAAVRFEVPYARDEQTAAADQLALTIAAWDSLDGREGWRALSAPLPAASLFGEPSRNRPWALTLPSMTSHHEGGHQLHVIGGVPIPHRADVYWPRLSRIVAAVLGRADCVLGDRGPLAYDAYRAGVIIRTREGEVDRLRLDGALAGLVPPTLTSDPELWRHVADSARAVHASQAPPPPLMTPLWVARGRDRMRAHEAAPPAPFERLRRRHDKLRRDPKRFLADSKYAPLRALGELMWGKP